MLMRHFNLMDKYISQSVNIYRTWISNVICRIRMSKIVKQIYIHVNPIFLQISCKEWTLYKAVIGDVEKRHMNRDTPIEYM